MEENEEFCTDHKKDGIGKCTSIHTDKETNQQLLQILSTSTDEINLSTAECLEDKLKIVSTKLTNTEIQNLTESKSNAFKQSVENMESNHVKLNHMPAIANAQNLVDSNSTFMSTSVKTNANSQSLIKAKETIIEIEEEELGGIMSKETLETAKLKTLEKTNTSANEHIINSAQALKGTNDNLSLPMIINEENYSKAVNQAKVNMESNGYKQDEKLRKWRIPLDYMRNKDDDKSRHSIALYALNTARNVEEFCNENGKPRRLHDTRQESVENMYRSYSDICKTLREEGKLPGDIVTMTPINKRIENSKILKTYKKKIENVKPIKAMSTNNSEVPPDNINNSVEKRSLVYQFLSIAWNIGEFCNKNRKRRRRYDFRKKTVKSICILFFDLWDASQNEKLRVTSETVAKEANDKKTDDLKMSKTNKKMFENEKPFPAKSKSNGGVMSTFSASDHFKNNKNEMNNDLGMFQLENEYIKPLQKMDSKNDKAIFNGEEGIKKTKKEESGFQEKLKLDNTNFKNSAEKDNVELIDEKVNFKKLEKKALEQLMESNQTVNEGMNERQWSQRANFLLFGKELMKKYETIINKDLRKVKVDALPQHGIFRKLMGLRNISLNNQTSINGKTAELGIKSVESPDSSVDSFSNSDESLPIMTRCKEDSKSVPVLIVRGKKENMLKKEFLDKSQRHKSHSTNSKNMKSTSKEMLILMLISYLIYFSACLIEESTNCNTDKNTFFTLNTLVMYRFDENVGKLEKISAPKASVYKKSVLSNIWKKMYGDQNIAASIASISGNPDRRKVLVNMGKNLTDTINLHLGNTGFLQLWTHIDKRNTITAALDPILQEPFLYQLWINVNKKENIIAAMTSTLKNQFSCKLLENQNIKSENTPVTIAAISIKRFLASLQKNTNQKETIPDAIATFSLNPILANLKVGVGGQENIAADRNLQPSFFMLYVSTNDLPLAEELPEKSFIYPRDIHSFCGQNFKLIIESYYESKIKLTTYSITLQPMTSCYEPPYYAKFVLNVILVASDMCLRVSALSALVMIIACKIYQRYIHKEKALLLPEV